MGCTFSSLVVSLHQWITSILGFILRAPWLPGQPSWKFGIDKQRFVKFLPRMPNSWLPVLRYQALEVDVMNISMRRVLQWNEHAVVSGWLWITSQLQAWHSCHSRENLTCNKALPPQWLYSVDNTLPNNDTIKGTTCHLCFPVTQACTTFCESPAKLVRPHISCHVANIVHYNRPTSVVGGVKMDEVWTTG